MDAETRAYLDAFRLEFRRDLADAMAALRQERRADLASLRQEYRADLAEAMAAGRGESRADLAEAMATLRGTDLASLRQEHRTDLADAIATLRTEIRSEAGQTRRHFDVVAEGLRGDIRLVAEGVVANTEAIERLRADAAREMDERFRVVHLAIGELRTLIR